MGRAAWAVAGKLLGRYGNRGSVALLTAISLPLLLAVVGFAADYCYASYINQRLSRATDMAALSALSQTAATAGGGYANTAYLQSVGVQVFNENIKQLSITGVNFTLTVTPDGNGGLVANTNYSYNVPTFFSSMIGLATMPLSGSIQSIVRPLTYVRYFVVIDVSQSMGIGATQADMNALYNRVVAYNNGSSGQNGCVFACHNKGALGGNKVQPYSNEDLAHNLTQHYGPYISLRVDAAVSAIKSIIVSASTVAGTNANVSIGLYTIQANPNDGTNIKSVIDPTTDYATLATKAASIALGTSTSMFPGDTDFVAELSALNNLLPANGNGASAASPLNYVFLVTDGVTDIYCNKAVTGNKCTTPLDASKCQPLKAKSTVGVIYTTYLPLYDENDPSRGYQSIYANTVAPMYNQIEPNLQDCVSSPGFYFKADDGPQLVSSMKALFAKTLPTSARLTQ